MDLNRNNLNLTADQMQIISYLIKKAPTSESIFYLMPKI